MGIKGLLPFVKSISHDVHISDLKGQRVAVDTYCLLHRSVCAEPSKYFYEQMTNQHVSYCEKYIELFKVNNITPVFVFDGRPLLAKKHTEKERKESREKNRRRAIPYIAVNDHSTARRFMIASIEVTHKMALDVIIMCRKKGVDTIVAPYEADAQLTFLCNNGFVDFVMSEDSDLIPFGCEKTVFKLSLKGTGVLVNRNELFKVFKISPDTFTIRFVQEVCILAGCDYLKSLPGIGLAKAHAYRLRTKGIPIAEALAVSTDFHSITDRQTLQCYIKKFQTAHAVMTKQYVYDPRNRHMVRLNADNDTEELPEAGIFYPDEVAIQAALGNIDPDTGKTICSLPLPRPIPNSIWCPLSPVLTTSRKFRAPVQVASSDQSKDTSRANTSNRTGETSIEVRTPEQVASINRTEDTSKASTSNGKGSLRSTDILAMKKTSNIIAERRKQLSKQKKFTLRNSLIFSPKYYSMLQDEREIVDDGIVSQDNHCDQWMFVTKSKHNINSILFRTTYFVRRQ